MRPAAVPLPEIPLRRHGCTRSCPPCFLIFACILDLHVDLAEPLGARVGVDAENVVCGDAKEIRQHRQIFDIRVTAASFP